MGTRAYFGSGQKAPQRQAARPQARTVAAHRPQQRAELRVIRTDRPLLSTEQVQQRLGLGSINAVYRLVALGLPRLELSAGLYRFDQDDLEAWLAQRREADDHAMGVGHGQQCHPDATHLSAKA